jgi:hypothetical protein
MPRTSSTGSAPKPGAITDKDYPRRITVQVTEEMHRKIRMEAARHGWRITDVVRNVLEKANWGKG